MSLILDGTTGVPVTTVTGTLPVANGGTGVTTAIDYGFRNRIINGAMVIDQRNAGASITPTASGTFTVDRWVCGLTQASKYSAQQSATAPTGFGFSLAITSTSAYSVLTGDAFLLQHKIEGFNTADLAWGTASAQTITVSFWVRSSLTGTFGGSIQNSAQSRTYPFTYTISSANTFEYKTVTIAGDTSGTWVGATNGIGLVLNLGLGCGATFSGTAGSWAAGNYFSSTGATSVVGTNGATFYITGVQLEKGSTATSFDYRPYGTELALCQRYFIKTNPDNASRCGGMWGSMLSTTSGHPTGSLPVAMRTAPTVVRGGTNDTFWVSGISATSAGTFSNFSSTTITIDSEVTGMSTSAIGYPVQYNGQLSLSSEL